MNQDLAVQSLHQQLVAAIGGDSQELMFFSMEFGPSAAIWAESQNQDALNELVSVACGKAALIGIQLQTSLEQFFLDALRIAGLAALGLTP